MACGASTTPRPLYLREKIRYPSYRRLGGPQGRSGRVRKISPPPGFDPRTVQPVASRYTDWAIPSSATTVTETIPVQNTIKLTISIQIHQKQWAKQEQLKYRNVSATHSRHYCLLSVEQHRFSSFWCNYMFPFFSSTIRLSIQYHKVRLKMRDISRVHIQWDPRYCWLKWILALHLSRISILILQYCIILRRWLWTTETCS